MRRVTKAYVDTPEGQVHVHLAAGDDPAIVFLHQTALSAKTYDPTLRVLDLPNRLIAIDTPGFGGSYDLAGMPTLAWYADQILATLDGLGAERFHLFGHHTGASLGIEIAARVPGRVLSLMLAGPVFMTAEESAAFVAGYHEPITPQRDGSHLMTNWGYSAQHNPECDVSIMQDAVADLLRAWRARPQAYMAVAHHDTAARAAEVQAPVLLLTTPGDFFRASFDRAEAIFPHARTTETGGDNFPAAADPHGMAAAIKAFVEALGD
jgi:pimeloyl-ACP methyl ester carboxylesterase